MSRKRPARPELSALLGASQELLKAPEATSSLPVTALRPALSQPRRAFPEASLEDLARSIRLHGVLQPLLVRAAAEGYEIVAGERRWRAAQRAGLTEVPVVVRDLSDAQARAAALIENLQRENLNVIDEVDAKLELVALALGTDREVARTRLMQLLREEEGTDHHLMVQTFSALGETWQGFTKNKLRILSWPASLLEALRQGLPHTLAAVIVAAPAQEHGRLIALARQGVTRAELRAEVAQLTQTDRELNQAIAVARKLSSRRFISSLSPDDQKAVARWLARMPEALKEPASQDH